MGGTTHPLVGEEQGAFIAFPLKGGAAGSQLLGNGKIAGYPRLELLQDALIAKFDEAALVEHDPTVGIVRISWTAREGSARDEEVVMGIVHGGARLSSKTHVVP